MSRWRWATGDPIPPEAFLEEARWRGFSGDPCPALPSHLVGVLPFTQMRQAWNEGGLAACTPGLHFPGLTPPPWGSFTTATES